MKNNLVILIGNMKHTKHTIAEVKVKSIAPVISGRKIQLPTRVQFVSYCMFENRIIGEQRSHLNQLDNIM
jgi:hypothetical protein